MTAPSASELPRPCSWSAGAEAITSTSTTGAAWPVSVAASVTLRPFPPPPRAPPPPQAAGPAPSVQPSCSSRPVTYKVSPVPALTGYRRAVGDRPTTGIRSAWTAATVGRPGKGAPTR